MTVWPDDRFEIEYFRGGDFRGIDQRQRSIGGFEDLIVSYDGGPLQGKAHIATFPFVKPSVDTMLKVAWE